MHADIERTYVVTRLAREFYVRFCEKKGEQPTMYPPDYSPRWAQDYANTAIDFLGYDDDVLDRLYEEVK
jgi:hypothetical protein